MLEIKHLDFDYPDKPVLSAVNTVVKPGQLLHLQGLNGSGKTTLLKLLAGLLRPESGDICYKGQTIFNDLATYQQHIVYIGQKPGISLLLTVEENCLYGMHPVSRSTVLSQIKQFGLEELENTPCGLLSTGQRRRVGLIKLNLSAAPIWLLDEPLVSLDQDSIQLLLTHMKRHLNNKGIIVIASHQTEPLQQLTHQVYSL